MGLRPVARVGHQLPPARHNFTTIPRIRSESPAFDINHPEAGQHHGVGAPGATGKIAGRSDS